MSATPTDFRTVQAQAIGQISTVRPPAPLRPVGPGFIAAYAFAYFGAFICWLTPAVVTLAVHVERIDPVGRVGSLSLVLGVGSIFALLGNPFFGRLSDRTTSRLGMRRPWMVGGALVALAGLLVIASAGTIPAVLAGWIVTLLGANALLAAVTAVLPDQVPVEQRGRVGGAMGIGIPLSMLVGTVLVQLFFGTVWMFLAPGVVALLGAVVLSAVIDDRRLDPARRPPAYTLREFAGSFWVSPRRHPDFGWAWISRFLVFLGIAAQMTYYVYYITDRFGYSQEQVAQRTPIIYLVNTVAVVVMSIVGGYLSDRTGRRKIFVLAAAIVYALGLVVIAIAPTWPLFLLGVAVTGLGNGMYVAVDMALIADVLPHPDNAAKELGVFNIANVLPQSLIPAVAPLILAIPFGNVVATGANYTALFVLGGALALVGAAAIRPVKGVK